MPQSPSRPKFLNLLRIRQPVMALASIAHRISGALLFVATPVLIYLLQLSLRDPAGHAQVAVWLQAWPVRLLGVVVGWALLLHLFAGVRFLMQDLGMGLGLPAARRTAWAVHIAGLLVLLVLLGRAVQ